jgi:hypothetical protein
MNRETPDWTLRRDPKRVWYTYCQELGQRGPYTVDEVFLQIAQGSLSKTDHAWREGIASWRPIGELNVFSPEATRKESAAEPAAAAEPTAAGATNVPRQELRLRLGPVGVKKMSRLSKRTQRYASLATVAALLWLSSSLWSPVFSFLRPYEVPALEDAFPQELDALVKAQATRGPMESRPIALAISKFNSRTPRFHVTSARPDETRVELLLVGVPGTLVGRPAYVQRQILSLKKGYAVSEAFLSTDAGPLPVGEYRVFARGLGAGEDGLTSLGPQMKKLLQSKVLPEGYHAQAYFVGGTRNEAYRRELAQYAEMARTERVLEIDEVSQYLGEMESMASGLRRALAAGSSDAMTKQQRAWEAYQLELSGAMGAWTEASVHEEFFNAELYLQTREAGQLLESYRNAANLSQGDASLALRSAEADLMSSLSGLKTRLQQARTAARQNLPN